MHTHSEVELHILWRVLWVVNEWVFPVPVLSANRKGVRGRERQRKDERGKERRQLSSFSPGLMDCSAVALCPDWVTMERIRTIQQSFFFHLYFTFHSIHFLSVTYTCEGNYTKRIIDFSVPVLLFHPSASLWLLISILQLCPERLIHHHLPAKRNPLSVYSCLHERLLCWHDCMGHTHTYTHSYKIQSQIYTFFMEKNRV